MKSIIPVDFHRDNLDVQINLKDIGYNEKQIWLFHDGELDLFFDNC